MQVSDQSFWDKIGLACCWDVPAFARCFGFDWWQSGHAKPYWRSNNRFYFLAKTIIWPAMTLNKRGQTGVGRDLVQPDPVCGTSQTQHRPFHWREKKLDLLRNSTHRDNNKTLFHCAYTHTYLTSTSAACYCHLMQPKMHSFTIMLTRYHIMRLDNWIITFDRYVVSEQ